MANNYGTTGNDSITGSTGDDYLSGGEGADTINAGAGNDEVWLWDKAGTDKGSMSEQDASGNNDLVDLGSGNDTIRTGYTGSNTIDGGDGTDFLNLIDASSSNSSITLNADGVSGSYTMNGYTSQFSNFEEFMGGTEDDRMVFSNSKQALKILASEGDDTIVTSYGDDTINGGDGSDVLKAGDGNDLIVGGTGGDSINAGSGNDTIYTGSADGNSDNGVDTVVAGSGDDLVYGSFGADTLDGGAGNDTYSQLHRGADVTIDLSQNTATVGGFVQTVTNFENAAGGSGDDTITGTNGANLLDGNQGDDSISAGSGDDTVTGDEGNDYIDGGSGDDHLSGGSDNNTLVGGGGNDSFTFTQGENLTITDFYAGDNSTTSDPNELDQIDLSDYYSDVKEAKLDLADDGILNQSAGDYSDNTSMDGGSIKGLDHLKNLSQDQLVQRMNLPCFRRGTLISTISGFVAVEQLKPGDKVMTRDNGIQEVRWIGSKVVAAIGNLAPVRIKAGALGHGEADIWLSPNHRVLKAGWDVDLLLNTGEVLISAKHLIGSPGVEQVFGGEVEYFHILFDQHEVILANGIWCESFHPGQEGMEAFDEEAREEILGLFPELGGDGGCERYGATARLVVKAYEANLLQAGGVL